MSLIEALRSYSQADDEGVMCIVSRQAVEEAADQIERRYGWQPIETAPTDQRSILGANERSGLIYVTHREAIGSDRYVRHNEPEGRGWRPTHWMAMPLPPARPVNET